jgi:CRISPR-associated protein Cmr5
MKTIEQERAKFCIEQVKQVKNERQDKERQDKKYKSAAKSLPAFIVSNGLIPTLAFYKSKEEKKPVYYAIKEWLKKRGFVMSDDAIKDLVESDFQTLRLATIEALAIANWLKRIVEVEIEDQADDKKQKGLGKV